MVLINDVLDENFDINVTNKQGFVLVDFWANWCYPCRRLFPVLEEVADEYHEKLKFFKMDVEKNLLIPKKYEVKGIPTLILFFDGNIISRKTGGGMSKMDLCHFLNQHI